MANSVISLSNGKKVAVQFDYDEKMMSHLNNAPSEPHIETKVKIVVRKGAKVLGTVEASSYCSPEDKFNLTHGRKLAVQRAFAKAATSLLNKEARTLIAQEHIVAPSQKFRNAPKARQNRIKK